MKRTAKLPVLVAALALTLTACAGGAGGDAAGVADSGSEVSSTLPDKVVEITDQQGSEEGFVGALEDAEVLKCEQTDQGWVSSGTVTNPTDTPQSYRIYVAFEEKSDTKGLIQVDIKDVAAGETREWNAEAAMTGTDLKCALRVERF